MKINGIRNAISVSEGSKRAMAGTSAVARASDAALDRIGSAAAVGTIINSLGLPPQASSAGRLGLIHASALHKAHAQDAQRHFIGLSEGGHYTNHLGSASHYSGAELGIFR